jgi:hypothetical protein
MFENTAVQKSISPKPNFTIELPLHFSAKNFNHLKEVDMQMEQSF